MKNPMLPSMCVCVIVCMYGSVYDNMCMVQYLVFVHRCMCIPNMILYEGVCICMYDSMIVCMYYCSQYMAFNELACAWALYSKKL